MKLLKKPLSRTFVEGTEGRLPFIFDPYKRKVFQLTHKRYQQSDYNSIHHCVDSIHLVRGLKNFAIKWVLFLMHGLIKGVSTPDELTHEQFTIIAHQICGTNKLKMFTLTKSR